MHVVYNKNIWSLQMINSVRILFFTVISVLIYPLYADVIIGNGNIERLNSGVVKRMNCQNYTINVGGVLDTSNGGTLREVTKLTINGTGDFGTGNIKEIGVWENNGIVAVKPTQVGVSPNLVFTTLCGSISILGTSDTDGDGISDAEEGDNVVALGHGITLDQDSDGIYNFLDDDSDNDGFLDSVEGGNNKDSNGNGIPDYLDSDYPGIVIPTPTPTPTPIPTPDVPIVSGHDGITISPLSAGDSLVGYSQGSHGAVYLDDGGTPNDPTDDILKYVPEAAFSGLDEFTYTYTDSEGRVITETVRVRVQNNDVGAEGITIDPLSDGGTLVSFTQPTHGIVTLDDAGTPDDRTDDLLRYVPEAGYSGPDSFTYTIINKDGNMVTKTFTLNVDGNKHSDNGNALEPLGMILMIFLLGLIGIISIRRET